VTAGVSATIGSTLTGGTICTTIVTLGVCPAVSGAFALASGTVGTAVVATGVRATVSGPLGLIAVGRLDVVFVNRHGDLR
jgi:hypothetical protein